MTVRIEINRKMYLITCRIVAKYVKFQHQKFSILKCHFTISLFSRNQTGFKMRHYDKGCM